MESTNHRSSLADPLNSEPTTLPESPAQPKQKTAEAAELRREEERERLLVNLLFRAKDLATAQIRYLPDTQRIVCTACQSVQMADVPMGHTHTPGCTVGRVKQILADLQALYAGEPIPVAQSMQALLAWQDAAPERACFPESDERIEACLEFCVAIETEKLQAVKPLARWGMSFDTELAKLFPGGEW